MTSINEKDHLGHVFFSGVIETETGLDAEQESVVEFLDKVNKNGYEVIYLTSRGMVRDNNTREYLFEVTNKMFSTMN